MAHPEHRAILKKGVEVWNRWREKHPGMEPDLQMAFLDGMDLSRINLTRTNLQRAHFDGVRLTGADLTGADLSGTNLSGADFSGADLPEASLIRTKLIGVDLAGAILLRANLYKADLTEADLTEAKLTRADLPGAILRRANLQGADLNEAILPSADLTGTNLTGARLVEAHLIEATFDGATLAKAHLIGTDLFGTSLIGVDLTRANLTRANLTRANLQGANLDGAILAETSFGNITLFGAKGLDTCHHITPSTLDHRTLANNPHLPKEFLRGCGLSDWQIEAAKLLNPTLNSNQIADIQDRMFELRAGRPIQVHNLFISYNHQDARFVNRLEPEFDWRGIRYWRDTHDAPAGPLEKIVIRAMRQNPTVLLVLSKHSTESDWIEFEVRKARELEKELKRDVLCPVALDDSWKTCRWPERLRQQITEYNILDFSKWDDASDFSNKFDRLVEGLHLFYEPGAGT